jgi:hypothetical protein
MTQRDESAYYGDAPVQKMSEPIKVGARLDRIEEHLEEQLEGARDAIRQLAERLEHIEQVISR